MNYTKGDFKKIRIATRGESWWSKGNTKSNFVLELSEEEKQVLIEILGSWQSGDNSTD